MNTQQEDAVRTQGTTCFSSQEYWPVLVEYLVKGRDYLLLLGDDGRILDANGAFMRDIAPDAIARGLSFLETLTEGSRHALRTLLSEGGVDGRTLELCHAVKGGSRLVCYYWRSHAERWILIGRDESSQEEIDSQMAALLEDIETRISTAQEGSNALDSADREPLAALASPEVFERTYHALEERLLRDGKGFAVISLDLDRFKEVNDFYGHPAGDLILERVARILVENIRGDDLIERTSGEEFMVLMPDLDLTQAAEVAERLRAAVEKGKMPERVRGITISAGIAAAPPGARGPLPDLLSLAGQALQEAKKNGRNCVRCAE